MNHRYAHILQPVKIGNVILKNRLIASRCVSQELQGPENFPAESTINYLANIAKNGAAIVTTSPGMFNESRVNGGGFASEFETDNRRVQTYLNRMIDRIHAYGSLASASTMSSLPSNVMISADWDRTKGGYPAHGPNASNRPEITRDGIKEFIERFTRHCMYYKTIGFDMINVYMSYNASILATSLSPVLNRREDEYGGSFENRARLTLELFRSIKEACGQDFLIEAQISGMEQPPYGYAVEDFLDYCQMCEGLVDIFHVRNWSGDLTHTNSYTTPKEAPGTLKYAEAFKKRGIKALVAPVGGFQDLDYIDRFISESRCDMVTMARAFICDDEYGKKLYEGRGEDVVPCIRCDKCHGAVCSVNPRVCVTYAAPKMFEAPSAVKKVAVIGGGPAGLMAATTAAERGHKVTLFEKNGYLGGQLRHADFMPEKWALRDFKNHLVRKAGKLDIDIRLGTEATPELVQAGAYDAVIAACGSEPKTGPVPGADGQNVWAPVDVFGREAELGHSVVVIGGTMMGADTALYLADAGHDVTLICRRETICYDNSGHSHDDIVKYITSRDNLNIIVEARTTLIKDDGVTFMDNGGAEHTVPADSVVFSAGRAPRTDECFKFAGLTPRYFVAGDSNIQTNEMYHVHELPDKAVFTAGDVRHAVYSAYCSASSL